MNFKNWAEKPSFLWDVKLKNLISRNKSKLLPNSFLVVYQLGCTSIAPHFDETKKKVINRAIEHRQNRFKGNQESSGRTEHCLECDE